MRSRILGGVLALSVALAMLVIGACSPVQAAEPDQPTISAPAVEVDTAVVPQVDIRPDIEAAIKRYIRAEAQPMVVAAVSRSRAVMRHHGRRVHSHAHSRGVSASGSGGVCSCGCGQVGCTCGKALPG